MLLDLGMDLVVEPEKAEFWGAVSEGKVGEVECGEVIRYQMEQSLVGHDKGLGFTLHGREGPQE